jgi:hypothetical protein
MKLTNQEQHIKSKMEHLNASINTTELWQSLETHVPKPSKKRRLVLWFLFPLILGLAALIFLFIPEPEEKGSIQPIAENLVKPIFENDRKSELANNNKLTESTTNTRIAIKNKKPKITINTVSKQNPLPIQNPKINSDHFVVNEALNDLNTNVQTQNLNGSSVVTSGSNLIEKLPPVRSEWKINPLAFDLEIDEPVFLVKKPAKKPFYFSINSQVGTGSLSFDSALSEDENYVEYLNDISILKPAIGLELMVLKPVSKRITIESGFHFKRQTIAHVPKWERMEEEEIISLSGATQTITRQVNYEAIGHLYHHMLSIPIQVDYMVFRSGFWEINSYAKILLPVYRSSKGYVLGNDLRLQKLSSVNTKWFDLKREAHWMIGIDLQRKIQSNCYVKAGINYGKNVNEYPYSEKNIEENHLIYHLNFGLKYRLN